MGYEFRRRDGQGVLAHGGERICCKHRRTAVLITGVATFRLAASKRTDALFLITRKTSQVLAGPSLSKI